MKVMLKKIIKKIGILRVVRLGIFKFSNSKNFRSFHDFPFNTLLPLPKGAVDVMENCCSFLDKEGVGYRVTDGTLLGIYRENKFIAHDNDLDFDLFNCNPERILSKMKLLGYKLGRIAMYKGVIHQLVFYTKDYVIVDFLFWYKVGDEYHNYGEENYLRIQDEKYFECLKEIEFEGFMIPVPRDIDDWMIMRYGNDWKVPKRYKGDWKDECFDMKRLDNGS